MDIIKIVGLGIIATILIVILREGQSQFGIYIRIVTGVIIFTLISTNLSYVLDTLTTLSHRVNIDFAYFSTLLKIIGMAYIVEFGSQISKDAGEDTIAMKIQLGGKVLIMVLALPILLALMELIIKILP